MKGFKKLLCVVMALTMVMGLSVSVFATDGDLSATPKLEGYFDTTTVDATLPTTSLAFTVDPQKLASAANSKTIVGDPTVLFANAIAATDGAAAVDGTVTSNIAADTNNDYIVTVSDLTVNTTYTYDGTDWKATGEDTATTVTITVKESDETTNGTIADGDTVTVSGAVAAVAGTSASTSYSAYSDAMTAVNNGLGTLNITVTAKATFAADATNKVTLADSSTFSGTTASLYLALVDKNDGTATSAGTKVLTDAAAGVTVTASLAGHAISDYDVTYTPGENGAAGTYSKALKSTATASETTLYLTGAANTNGLWGGVTFPSVSVVWTAVNPAATTSSGSGSGSGGGSSTEPEEEDEPSISGWALTSGATTYEFVLDPAGQAVTSVTRYRSTGEVAATMTGTSNSDGTIKYTGVVAANGKVTIVLADGKIDITPKTGASFSASAEDGIDWEYTANA